MRSIKEIKTDRRGLFLILGDTYTEHIPLDSSHSLGKDLDCHLCCRYNQINTVMERLEEELDTSYIQETGARKVKESLKQTKVNMYYVTFSNGDQLIEAAPSKRSLSEKYSNAKVELIYNKELKEVAIGIGNNKYQTLDTVKKSLAKYEIVAEREENKEVGICTHKANASYIRYSDNQEDVISFCKPNKATITKKQSIQILTSKGSFSVKKGEYIVKNILGRLEAYDEEEFYTMYQFEVDSWIRV